jgi:hypothetical protein
VTGTLYEAIQYAVFSIFLLLSAIRSTDRSALFPHPLYSFSSKSQKNCHTHSCKNTMYNTSVYTAIVSVLKGGRRAKHYEAAV